MIPAADSGRREREGSKERRRGKKWGERKGEKKGKRRESGVQILSPQTMFDAPIAAYSNIATRVQKVGSIVQYSDNDRAHRLLYPVQCGSLQTSDLC